MNILQKINKVMMDVQYLQKDASIQSYKAVTHDYLVSKARPSLVKYGITVKVDQISGGYDDTQNKVLESGKSKQRLYCGEYCVYLVNVDDPNDFVSSVVHAHAMDSGDKAPGKAVTYAVKSAILKLLWLETGENDESRGDGKPYTEEQHELFMSLLDDKNAIGMYELQDTVGHDAFIGLYNSFKEGKVKGKQAVDKLISEAHEKFDEWAIRVDELAEKEDSAISEMLEGTPQYKRAIWSRLTLQTREYIQEKKAKGEL